ncbi:repressor [Lactococcus phage CHPC974]|nr:repressor [Lactococcus phage CHPC974]
MSRKKYKKFELFYKCFYNKFMKWVSFDGRPLTDEVKEAMKKATPKNGLTKSPV